MIPFSAGLVSCLGVFFRSRYNLGLEILALRQQLGVLKRKNPRPRLRFHDRMFWVLFRRLWPLLRRRLNKERLGFPLHSRPGNPDSSRLVVPV